MRNKRPKEFPWGAKSLLEDLEYARSRLLEASRRIDEGIQSMDPKHLHADLEWFRVEFLPEFYKRIDEALDHSW